MSDFKKARRSDISLDQVVRTLAELDLGTANRLWIAFSGGLDSTVLLKAAVEAHEPHQLAVVHVNHNLSPNAASWETHCESTALSLGLEFHARRVSLHGKNLEYEGRQARLRVFEDVMCDGDVLATAHHRDDELESLAWQLITGRALVGIANWRRLEHGRLWRPLLRYTRDELRHLATLSKWVWVEDESNQDITFTRNALRHEVLPHVKAAFSDFESQLLDMKEPPLEQLPRKPIEAKLLCEDSTKVRAWLHAFNITPKSSVVKEIMRQANARRDAQVLVRVSPHACVRRYKRDFFVVPDSATARELPIRVGKDVSFPFGALTWTQVTLGLPSDTQIQSGFREGGETLITNDRCIKLSKWFHDHGIPPWERDAWPLLYQNTKLIAVPGLGVDPSVCTPGGYSPNWRRIEPYR